MYIKRKKLVEFRPNRILKKSFEMLNDCKRYHSPLTIKYFIFLLSYIRCYVKEGYKANEVNRLGLGKSLQSAANMSRFISIHRMREIDNELNPKSWKIIVNDKGVFSAMCKLLDLPCPQWYAILFQNQTGISFINSSLIKKGEIIEFIREDLPNEFVVKPCRGWGGESINFYTKTKGGIIDGCGNLRTVQDIYEDIVNNKYRSFIIQERLRNHSDLIKIYPSENLHTIRIISLIDSSGQFKILHAHLNVATEQDMASQLSSLKFSISINDGRLDYGIHINKSIGGFERITVNPATGQQFDKLKIPFWGEISALVEEGAFKLLPLRTLGWDIAISDNGVQILETNVNYTPPNYFTSIGEFKNILLTNK